MCKIKNEGDFMKKATSSNTKHYSLKGLVTAVSVLTILFMLTVYSIICQMYCGFKAVTATGIMSVGAVACFSRIISLGVIDIFAALSSETTLKIAIAVFCGVILLLLILHFALMIRHSALKRKANATSFEEETSEDNYLTNADLAEDNFAVADDFSKLNEGITSGEVIPNLLIGQSDEKPEDRADSYNNIFDKTEDNLDEEKLETKVAIKDESENQLDEFLKDYDILNSDKTDYNDDSDEKLDNWLKAELTEYASSAISGKDIEEELLNVNCRIITLNQRYNNSQDDDEKLKIMLDIFDLKQREDGLSSALVNCVINNDKDLGTSPLKSAVISTASSENVQESITKRDNVISEEPHKIVLDEKVSQSNVKGEDKNLPVNNFIDELLDTEEELMPVKKRRPAESAVREPFIPRRRPATVNNTRPTSVPKIASDDCDEMPRCESSVRYENQTIYDKQGRPIGTRHCKIDVIRVYKGRTNSGIQIIDPKNSNKAVRPTYGSEARAKQKSVVEKDNRNGKPLVVKEKISYRGEE